MENIAVGKIVATPSLNCWSQAYNAGNLFAVLSLEYPTLSENEEDTLNVLGKEIIDTLEKEYYASEEKNLSSIRQAIDLASAKIPQDIFACLAVCAIIKNAGKDILYAFSLGEGKIMIKRGEKLGTVLEIDDPKKISAASGFLEDDDVVILQTEQFSKVIPKEELSKSLDHLAPAEIAEALSPKIHQEEKGGASAIVLLYKKTTSEKSQDSEEEIKQEKTPEQEEKKEEKQKQNRFPKISILGMVKPFFGKFSGKINFQNSQFSHKRKLFLSIAIVLLIVLLTSSVFAYKKREDTKIKALFSEIITPAQKDYDEGQSLVSLNKNLARDDFDKAKKILEEGKPKFKQGTVQEKQISDLLQKVNDALSSALEANSADAKPVDDKESRLLAFEKSNSSAYYFTFDSKNIYSADDKGINSADLQTLKTKQIIKIDWKEIGGLGTFLGNIYVLDKKSNQILKFVSGSFTKTNYLLESADLSNASSLTIDSSIYVLANDGVVSKFTKGKKDTFSVSGLDKPLSKPTRIFTDADTNNIYILDNGNSRIVILDKKGDYQSQYQAKVLKDTNDFEVKEADKKIFILSGGKIYQIELK
ncbi:MAG: hypothetical protein Q8P80_02105 [Candidatus Levybacteria bacterium]|nr:hypothetical protein [Candidatus Levybacteria bacterium]